MAYREAVYTYFFIEYPKLFKTKYTLARSLRFNLPKWDLNSLIDEKLLVQELLEQAGYTLRPDIIPLLKQLVKQGCKLFIFGDGVLDEKDYFLEFTKKYKFFHYYYTSAELGKMIKNPSYWVELTKQSEKSNCKPDLIFTTSTFFTKGKTIEDLDVKPVRFTGNNDVLFKVNQLKQKI